MTQAMQANNKLAMVFGAFDALHVSSDGDVIELAQGNSLIRLPAQLVQHLIQTLKLAEQGEI